MSEEIANVPDPKGWFGNIYVTRYGGPAGLGEDRRCIQLTASDGDFLPMSFDQWLRVVAATQAALGKPERPRVIEAKSSSSDHDTYVVVDRILEIQVYPGKPYGASDHGWTARIVLDSPIEISCYRIFETEGEAHGFARETLGMEAI